MLIPLRQLIQAHRMKITGVVHVGSHYGQEIREYQRANIRRMYMFEPCEAAYNILRKSYPRVTAFQYALGASEGDIEMNVERKNKGQSNSLLKPVLHLEQFPDIIFDEVEIVKMRTLDSFKLTGCNFLNMDVQGYELEVLKGATETLKGINYIYTEVNRDEVYENCVRVEQLDKFLYEFERVETNWGGGTWGDALYIRKKPNEFQPHACQMYPPDNDLIFEEWFAREDKPVTEREYLPVNWTSYYVNNRYGKNKEAMGRLQQYINGLDKTKKYYTVIQYDDGILNDVSHLDLKVFSMSGYGQAIPLVCKPHEYKFNSEKKYLANFIGKRTHFMRNEIFKINHESFYIAERTHNLEQYCKIISESVLTLCPRGYGKSSFRIQEAVQYGSIPVYISNDFILPPEFESYGILIDDEKQIKNVLLSLTKEQIKEKQTALIGIFEKYFTYDAVKEYILNNI